MTASALRYVSVSKHFGSRRALDDVSFEVQKGEVFGLLGPNGAGKTTLIRLALDILRADAGEVTVLDRPVRSADHDRIAYLPEERGLYRQLRVADVLAYFGQLKGLGRRQSYRRAHGWLERLGLSDVAKKKIEQLSKGMGQKVQIAAALIADPELAILDEPFSGLDPIHVEQVLDIIRDRRERGRTTILSTHLMDRVEAVCDRMVLMSQGKVVLEGTLRAIREAHRRAEVIAELEGIDPTGIGGVEETETLDDGALRLLLAADQDPAQTLDALIAAGARIARFAPVRPTIEQIFVSTVRRAEERQ